MEELIGGFTDWQRSGGRFENLDSDKSQKLQETTAQESISEPVVATETVKAKPKKLSYKIQRELDEMPDKLAEQELLVESLQEVVAASDFYQKDHEYVTEQLEQMSEAEQTLEDMMERWVELEAMASGD